MSQLNEKYLRAIERLIKSSQSDNDVHQLNEGTESFTTPYRNHFKKLY